MFEKTEMKDCLSHCQLAIFFQKAKKITKIDCNCPFSKLLKLPLEIMLIYSILNSIVEE
jgi:hypothetical protein